VDPLTLVLGALASVATVAATMFKLLMAEKDKALARLERDGNARAGDLKQDNDWLRDKVASSLEAQIRALELMSTAIKQQGETDRSTGDAVREVLALLRGQADPRPGPGR
jgi:hypothetical protein